MALSNPDHRKYNTDKTIESACLRDQVLSVEWSDGNKSEFDETWLQDNCRCDKCVHPETLEPIVYFIDKRFKGIQNLAVKGTGLEITWANNHISFFASGWLRAHDPVIQGDKSPIFDEIFQLWDASDLKLPEFEYETLIDPNRLCDALLNLQKVGVILIRNTPVHDGFAMKFANRIGELRQTAFGEYFDVVSKAEPNSNGYTSMELRPHIDIAHYEIPPAYQILHFLENEAEGGLSTLVDGFKLALTIKNLNPTAFKQLTKPIYTFRFQDDTMDHSYRGPIISLDENNYPKQIRMDLDILEPIIGSINEVRESRAAIKLFFDLATSEKFQFSMKLEAGDLMLINNTRMLHGRTSFNPATGKRRLQVCYLDKGVVFSQINVLNRTVNKTNGSVYDDGGNFLMNTLT